MAYRKIFCYIIILRSSIVYPEKLRIFGVSLICSLSSQNQFKSKQIRSSVPRKGILRQSCVIADKRGFCGAVRRNRSRPAETSRICESGEAKSAFLVLTFPVTMGLISNTTDKLQTNQSRFILYKYIKYFWREHVLVFRLCGRGIGILAMYLKLLCCHGEHEIRVEFDLFSSIF